MLKEDKENKKINPIQSGEQFQKALGKNVQFAQEEESDNNSNFPHLHALVIVRFWYAAPKRKS